uniref:eIF5-mimic protein 1 n=2 Tax=Seriola lalandi dorsalis TaxID=1841481 RepID=A0A3B4W8Z0_SERLL
MLTGILLANSTLPPPIITGLFTESVVKEGISALFAVRMFKSWIAEKDANSVTSSLRKANLDKRLLELFPASKQNVEHFSKYFNEAGLKELSDFLHVQQSLGTRKELQRELQERLSQQCPIREVKTAPSALSVSQTVSDVLSEEAILKWYKDSHAAKGKSVFLEQMKKFVEWLQNAEEGNNHEFFYFLSGASLS